MAKPIALREGVAACLVFSGLSALVYQIAWVRLLGVTFGTTTAAVSTVLAVFFAGLALGDVAAASQLRRIRRPLRVYAVLELQRVGVDELLARLAGRLGDERAARAWADVALDARRRRGQSVLAGAQRAFDAKRLDAAAAALVEAEKLMPTDRAALELQARVALARGDGRGFAAALEAMREWSPSFDDAVISENRFLHELGLPLLPRLSAEEILAAPPPPASGDQP